MTEAQGVLTDKQQRFVEEYLVDLNATQAAIRAGFPLTECARPAGYYVYALIDPRNDEIFYVGKGKGKRFAAHAAEWRSSRVLNAEKFNRIAEIDQCSMKLRAVLLASRLSEADAFDTERAFISEIGIWNLTNCALGQSSERAKEVAWAMDAARRLKPIRQWHYERSRSELQVRCYFLLVISIAEILLGRRVPEARALLRTG